MSSTKATVCKNCGNLDDIYSSIHPLSPQMFAVSCKCENTCACGRYIDDYGLFLGMRAYMACNCALKEQRMLNDRKTPKLIKVESDNSPFSYRPPWKSNLLNHDM
jgi:hypothetical protein